MTDFFQSPPGTNISETAGQKSTRPRELVVNLEVPRMQSPSSAQLDVDEKRLVFSVPNVYHVDIPLPYAVDHEKSRAKFDRKAGRLSVSIPVLPPPSSSPQSSSSSSSSSL